MSTGNEIILVAGVLSLLAVFAGFASTRVGTPLLLALIGVGMLAGSDGPGGIEFSDFPSAYLIGSIALAVILFQGGLGTERSMLRKALWPSVALATAGVAVSTGIIGAATVLLLGASWPAGLLLGATTAPTDAAAIAVLLRLSRLAVPSRVVAALELESGLNDPMSVFLTLALIEWLKVPGGMGVGAALLMFLREMGGGLVIGIVSGWLLVRLFRWLDLARSAFPVLALGCTLTVFGGAQVAGASGFLAVYLAGMMVGLYDHPAGQSVTRFFDTLGWLAQNALFLMLGLLVTPHQLPPLLLAGLALTGVLVLIARPASVAACLLPFRWTGRETLFVAWAGLRGGVPIYLTIIPLLSGISASRRLFDIVFVVVIVSVAAQGSTVKLAARLLGLREDPAQDSAQLSGG
ncbi:MAG: potassium/proton antiporter [Steroidobacteraceae bacterium]